MVDGIKIALSAEEEAELHSEWLADEQRRAIEDSISTLKQACREKIEGGFVSSALGAPHTYASTIEDQINLIGAASTATNMLYQCTDSNGVKAEVMHTSAQIWQVFADGVAHKRAALTECRSAIAAL